MKKLKLLLVDPPSGWKYGFPRPYNAERDGDLGQFLVDHGYPVDDLDFALKHMRFIGTSDDRIDVV